MTFKEAFRESFEDAIDFYQENYGKNWMQAVCGLCVKVEYIKNRGHIAYLDFGQSPMDDQIKVAGKRKTRKLISCSGNGFFDSFLSDLEKKIDIKEMQ